MTPLIYHPSGALYIPKAQAIIVADLHLGYGLAQRRRGQLGPVADTKTAEKLQAVLDELMPKQLILLGDAVHAPNPGALERAWIAENLNSWESRSNVVFVRGNHDRRIGQDFRVQTVDQWTFEGLTCIHGDGAIPMPSTEQTVVLGHIHPAISISDGGGGHRRMPIFLLGPQVLVLPAFSPFAAGVDVIRKFPDELRLFGEAKCFNATVATGRRVVELGPISKIQSPALGSRPESFRQWR